MTTPNYWKNNPEAIQKVVLDVRHGRRSVLTQSQGGRDIHLIEYGEKLDTGRRANFNAAAFSRDLSAYADKSLAKPVVLIVGATHGGEFEGIAAVLNLITELESGKDLSGHSHGWLENIAENYRLLIIPCLNPDGRARVPFEIVPENPEEAAYYKTGQYNGGKAIHYRNSADFHPILDAVSYLGGYYNDAGVNLYLDNFFSPMAPENRALLRLIDQEAPDFTLLLHTGCHRHGKLVQPYYAPGFILDCVSEFDDRLCSAFVDNGYTYYSLRENGLTDMSGSFWPPARLSMETAVTLSCGGLGILFESPEASPDPEHPFFLETILACHFILFEQAFLYASEFREMSLNAKVDDSVKLV